jgi:hypothetical protein
LKAALVKPIASGSSKNGVPGLMLDPEVLVETADMAASGLKRERGE